MSLGKLREHRALWERKASLRAVYGSWFERLFATLPDAGVIFEVGAGPAFLGEAAERSRPRLEWISTDITAAAWHDVCADAQRLPVRHGVVNAVVGLDVLHHLDAPRRFFEEASDALAPGGSLVLIEPWISAASLPVYRWLHQEDCRPGLDAWRPFGNRLDKAPFEGDQALPWKLLRTTRPETWNELGFDAPRVERINGLAYLLSLGFRPASLLPSWLVRPLLGIDRVLEPLSILLAFRALLVWRRAGPGVDVRGGRSRRAGSGPADPGRLR